MVNELTNHNKHTTDHDQIHAQISMLLCLHDINFAFSNNNLKFSCTSNLALFLLEYNIILNHLNNLFPERKFDETYG